MGIVRDVMNEITVEEARSAARRELILPIVFFLAGVCVGKWIF